MMASEMRYGGWRLLREQPEFLKLWTGQAVSSFGTAITTLALPLTAVLVLHATPLQMGALTALAVLPHLLLALPAGIWVDRLPRRSILVVADTGRALLLGSIPILGALGVLRIEQLYAIAFATGVLTLLFDTAAMTLLPALSGRGSLVEANAAWQLNTSVAMTVGPSVSGALVQLFTAPIAIALDAVSYVVSAVCSLLVRVPSDASSGAERGPVRPLSEIADGLKALFGSPVLTAVAVSGTVGAFAGAMQGPLLVLYYVRGLHLVPTEVGLTVAAGGVAAVAGSLVAPALSHRLGPGPTYLAGGLLAGLAGLALAGAGGPPPLLVPLLLAGQVAWGAGPPLYGVNQRALRQAFTPDHLLGRVNATWRFFVFGAQPLGALLGGALGATIGLRQTLALGSLGILLAVSWAATSPLRRLRHLPA